MTSQELDAAAAALNRDGIVVLPGLFDPALIDRWYEAFDAEYQRRQNLPGGLAPREQGRFYFTFPWRPPFADPGIFAHPDILGIIDRVFAQEYEMVQLAVDFPIEGSDYQQTHRDYRPLFSDDFFTPLYALAVNFPLVDVTAENGPLEMARGTHRLPKDDAMHRVESGAMPLEPFYMKRGDVAIRTPLAMHRGTPNRTAQPRPMVVMGYVMHWLLTRNVNLTIDRPTWESYPEKLRGMLRAQVVDRLRDDAGETYLEFKY